MNKKRELRGLFHKYIDRKEREERTRPSAHNPYYCNGYGQGSSSFREGFNGTIYFYEWSNARQEPKRYYTLEGFKGFLRESGIYLALYQEDIIKNIRWAYISCKKGTKDLIIRQSYVKLCEELEKTEEKHSIGFEAMKPQGVDREPYVVGITRPPHMKEAFEPEGRWFG